MNLSQNIIILIITITPLFLAQIYTDTSHGQEFGEISLHVPPTMIQNIEYEGMILLKEPATTPYTILLASDGHANVPYDITIPPGYNHAIFPIHPTEPGDAAISAIPPNGDAVRTYGKVFENKNSTKLHMIPPHNSIRIQNIPIIIYHTDQLGNRVIVPHDTTITISASPSIQVRPEITIPKGHDHTILDATIHDTGTIKASAPNVIHDTITISKHPDAVNVRIGMAPNPAPPGEAISYFVWIEQNGIPHILAAPHDTYIITDDPQVAGPYPGTNNDIYRTEIDGDMLHGFIYTAETAGPDEMRPRQDVARITASVPGIGSDTAILHVGAQPPDAKQLVANALRECVSQNSTIFAGHCGHLLKTFAVLGGQAGEISGNSAVQRALRSASIQPHPDTTKLWAFPDTPYHRIWLVAGFYHSVHKTDITIPTTPPDTVHITLSDDTQTLPEYMKPYKGIGPIQTQIKTPGPFDITLSGPGFVEGRLTINGPPHIFGYTHITPVPASHNTTGILGMISILDADGHAIQPGAYVSNLTTKTQGNIHIHDIKWHNDTAIIHGTNTGAGTIRALMPPFEPHTTQVSHVNHISGISVWMPDTVHISEEFPVTVHAIDSQNSPVFRIYDAVFSSTFASISPHSRMIADHTPNPHKDTGTVAALWRGMADWHDIQTFQNDNIIQDIRIESGQYTIPLGQNITIQITAPTDDADINIHGDFPYHRHNGTYTAQPTAPGTYTSNITISRPGWDTHFHQIQHKINHDIPVQYVSSADSGAPPSHIISLNLADVRHDIHPGTTTMIPPGTYTVHIPHQLFHIDSDEITYKLSNVIIDDHNYIGAEPSATLHINNKTKIKSTYDKTIYVHVTGNIPPNRNDIDMPGSGQYAYNDTVQLHAESISEWWGLIWLVPKTWESLPHNAIHHDTDSVSFRALEPADITIHYEYSYFVLIVIFAMASSAPPIIFRDRITDAIRVMQNR